MATTIGNGNYGNYGAALPPGMTEAQLAAKNLFEANQVNALRVGPSGSTTYAFDSNGQSTGGANTPAWSPGTAGYNPSQPGGQMASGVGGTSSGGNPYLSGGGAGGTGGAAWGQSPWVKQTADALTAQSNQNLMQNVMPQIRSGAQSAGQYGGSRQGIAEGVAAGNAQTGLNSALAGLYGTAYGQDQNASLQNKSLDNSFNLGLGNLGLTNQGQMQSFYTNQRGQDLSQAQLGANIYGAGNQGNLGIGSGQYTLGQTQQNAPMTALQQYNAAITPYTGFGQSTTQTGSSGGGLQGIAGGVLSGAQMQNNLGFGNGVSYTPAQIASANSWNTPTSAPAAPAFWPNA